MFGGGDETIEVDVTDSVSDKIDASSAVFLIGKGELKEVLQNDIQEIMR